MKKLVNIVEETGEGLVKLMGERVTLFCMNYIYEGKLIGVNTQDILLEDAGIVYETGSFSDSKFKDRQAVAKLMYVRTGAIESYAVLDKK